MQNDTDIQDRVLFEENGRIALIAVADGVSSCKNSGIGASIACETIKKIMTEECDYYFSCKQDYTGILLLSFIQRELQRAAADAGEDVTSYASTLSFVCLHKKSGMLMVFSLGDSKVYSVGANGMKMLNDAQADEDNRCCATVTQGAEEQVFLQVLPYDGQTDYLLMTDGAWRLLYTDCCLRTDLKTLIEDRNYCELTAWLESMQPTDDCSFVALQADKQITDCGCTGGQKNG